MDLFVFLPKKKADLYLPTTFPEILRTTYVSLPPPPTEPQVASPQGGYPTPQAQASRSSSSSRPPTLPPPLLNLASSQHLPRYDFTVRFTGLLLLLLPNPTAPQTHPP